MEINSLLSTHGLSGLWINQAGDAVTSVYLLRGKLTSDQQAVSIETESYMNICQIHGSLQPSSRLPASQLCEGLASSPCRLQQRCAVSASGSCSQRGSGESRGETRTLLCTAAMSQVGLIYAVGSVVIDPTTGSDQVSLGYSVS